MTRERSSQLPAAAGSVLLHAAVLAFGLLALPWLSHPLKMGDVVPVTLITSEEQGALKNAAQSPDVSPAQTPEPTPQAPAQTAAPEPAPVPQPAPPQPKPPPAKPVPAPPKPAPSPQKPQPAKEEKSLDLDALAKSLAPAAKRAAGAQKSSAAKGPPKPATAVQAQATAGASDVASTGALASMAAELQRIWNPNCDVSGGADANIKVSFRLAPNGGVLGDVQSSGDGASDPVMRAASDRAKSAVGQAAPFQNLPHQLYGPRITVNFNARQACGQR
ncbi:energy transducer TonB [Phenylobacterium montanum]|uniref:Energy transducer TonB n=1 Tax=Phenylobacterium montanum TaxID=2823693 RepID=A0A975ITR1_9CAUL|nr:energy transducer TonB [Caulobacter sp. S6]QUD87137.1 energy transducer TonB [Caulobacter sp. S6]